MRGEILVKKRDLWTGLLFTAAGILCIAGALLLRGVPLGDFLAGMSGGIGVPGVLMLYKYYKYTSPKHAAEYRERLEQEQIELRDERKEMLRNKSGRYAYVFNMLMNCVVMFVLSLLKTLGVLEVETWVVLGLAVWLLAQYFVGIIFYKVLERKY